MLPHLDAAFNLARHLSRSQHDAEDVVQDAYLRAWRHYASFRGDNARGWLLAIVRHAALSHRRRDTVADLTDEFNDAMHSEAVASEAADEQLDRDEASARLHRALDALPFKFREVLVLRELEELSYQDIGRIVRAPVGTVMSRLSRARARLDVMLTRLRRDDL